MVEGEHHERTSLDQHHGNNMERVLTAPYLNIPQLVNVEILKVQPLIRNLFETKLQRTLLEGRLKFHKKVGKN